VVGHVVVVDDHLDRVVVVDYEGVDLAVDDWVTAVVARGGGAVEGRDLLVDVGEIVEACPDSI
jgi:hypothetical protein